MWGESESLYSLPSFQISDPVLLTVSGVFDKFASSSKELLSSPLIPIKCNFYYVRMSTVGHRFAVKTYNINLHLDIALLRKRFPSWFRCMQIPREQKREDKVICYVSRQKLSYSRRAPGIDKADAINIWFHRTNYGHSDMIT